MCFILKRILVLIYILIIIRSQKYLNLIFGNYKVLYTLIIIASLFSLVVEHPLSKREVIGSTPVGGLHFLFLSF